MVLKRINVDYFYLLFSIVVVYSVLLSMQVMITYDYADQCFPWRMFTSEVLLNGELPLWNPYQLGGIPIHGDPQAGAWYPFVHFYTLIFGKYTLYSTIFELVFTLFLASVGFYKLCIHFSVSRYVAVICGLVFASSGFFVGNMQHLSYVVSGAYLPFLFLYLFRICDFLNWKDAIKFGLVISLMLTGGYPAFLIVSFYLVLIICLFKFYQFVKEGNIIKFFGLMALAGFVFLLSSSVMLYSLYTLMPLTGRGSGVSLSYALQGAFNLPCFWSFVLPFATVKNPNPNPTDISMMNAYFGILFFILFLSSLFNPNFIKKHWLFYLIGISCLLVSVGDLLPFRTWLYYHIPLMNMFRFPALIRVFFIIFFLLISASYLSQISRSKKAYDHLNIFFFLVGVFLLMVAIFNYFEIKSTLSIFTFFFSDFGQFKQLSTVSHFLFIQSIFQFIILGLFYFLFQYKSSRYFKQLFFMIVLLDCFFSANLNLPFTGYFHGATVAETEKRLNTQPQGIQVNDSVLLSQSNDLDGSLFPFWKNLCIYKKQIGTDGYDIFFIEAYNKFSESAEFKNMLEHKFYFLADEKSTDSKKVGFYTKSDKLSLKQNLYDLDSADAKKSIVTLLHFSANQMELEARDCKNKILVVFQNLLEGHVITVNKKVVSPFKINNTLIGIPIDQDGIVSVGIEYAPKYIQPLFILSATCFLFFFALSLYFSSKDFINTKEQREL